MTMAAVFTAARPVNGRERWSKGLRLVGGRSLGHRWALERFEGT